MSFSSIMFGIIFGAIGMAYFAYGRKNADFHFLISGIVLIAFSYFVQNPVVAFIVGIILCLCPIITSRIF